MTEDEQLRAGLGHRLMAARKNKGLTQTEVGARFGIEKGTVSAWETGRGVPDALRLARLAKLYDVSTDALLWDDSLSSEAMQVAAWFDSLNDEQQRTYRAVILAFVQHGAENGNRLPVAPQGVGEGAQPETNRGGTSGFGDLEQTADRKSRK